MAKHAAGKLQSLGTATPELGEALRRLGETLRGESLVMPGESAKGSAGSAKSTHSTTAPPAAEFILSAEAAESDGEPLRAETATGARGVGKSFPGQGGKAFQPQGLVEQVSTMVQHIFVGRVTTKSMSLLLNPPTLGRLRIDIAERSEHDSRLHVVLRADRPETERLLDQHLAALREALEEGGVDLGDLVLEHSGNGLANSGGDDDTAPATPRHSSPTEEEAPETKALFGRPRGTGRLSVVA